MHFMRSDIIQNVTNLELTKKQQQSLGLQGLETHKKLPSHLRFIPPSEELSSETLKLFLDIINITELRYYCDKLGITLDFLSELQQVWQ